MNTVEITSSSTKGQVVIPSKIRKQLGIKAGTKLIAITDGICGKKGITENELRSAIRAARNEKNHS